MPFEPLDEAAPLGQRTAEIAIPAALGFDPDHQSREVEQPADKAQSAEVLKFFDWSFKSGKQMAAELDYVALPDSLTNEIRSKVWSQIAK